ncbi:unnamed protein product [Caenorhabditis nigoni]|uniref:Uncharacterized protein n=1 Tax=Caenorhabditis nigoni TaxID=1611254 RepID=A0A2G5SF75_9PELO|nr:hypothetical protein B9Z55_027554 [Caenorhabditis nigoni]
MISLMKMRNLMMTVLICNSLSSLIMVKALRIAMTPLQAIDNAPKEQIMEEEQEEDLEEEVLEEKMQKEVVQQEEFLEVKFQEEAQEEQQRILRGDRQQENDNLQHLLHATSVEEAKLEDRSVGIPAAARTAVETSEKNYCPTHFSQTLDLIQYNNL